MEALRNLQALAPAGSDGSGVVPIADAAGRPLGEVWYDLYDPDPISRRQALNLARKAAAAPEMFDALSALIEGADVVLADGPVEVQAALADGNAALAKARGTAEGWIPLAVPAAELAAALDKLRGRFHAAVVAGGSDREFADEACAEVDALLARTRGEGR